MIRTTVVSALVLTAAFAVALTPVRCLGEDANQLPAKDPLPAKATKELPRELFSLINQKKMPKLSAILVRIFKEEAELEVWKQDTTGRFQLLKTFPICRWSGDIGPKEHEGDRQTPEGFYTITPELMNPNSSFFLAINTGFPNAFDKANARDGSFLMIHGDCSSSGCYSMTDEQMGEIYSLARDSFLGGHPSFQIQAYPFRLTPANLARHHAPLNSPTPLVFVERLAADLDLAIRTATSLRTLMLGADFLPPAPRGRPGLPMTPAVRRVIAAHAAILAILDDDRRPEVVPPIRRAERDATRERWSDYWARLTVDAGAVLD